MAAQEREQRTIQLPGGYDPAIAPWVWALEDTRRRTKQCLDGVAEEVISWSPPEGGNSIGSLLYHLVAIELSYLYEDILEVGWAAELQPLLPYDVRDDQGQLVAVQGEPIADYLQRLDAARALLCQAMRSMTEGDLRRVHNLEDYEITAEWAFHHLMQHEAEHRGQICELRLRAEQALEQ
jgi:uncharacterized damage-inducible protein DinB